MSDLEHCDVDRRRIIERLIKKLTLENVGVNNEDYITMAARYTGLHPKVINTLDSGKKISTDVKPVDRSVIYKKLVYFYTVADKIPNTYELFNSLYDEIPAYIDIGKFRKMLVKMDFVWKKVCPTHAVVIEKPLVRFERYNYLKRIQFHRTRDSNIYYISSGSLNSLGQYNNLKMTKDSQQYCVQRVIYALGPDGVIALTDIEDFTNEIVEAWVTNALIPEFSQPTVFILNNAKHHNGKLLETPNLDSLKIEIISWLDRHDITYDPEMSKYELLALAENFTDLNSDLFKIDEMLKARGHTVLRIPKSIENFTSVTLLQRVYNEVIPAEVKELQEKDEKFANIQRMIKDQFKILAVSHIEGFEEYIGRKEKELVEIEDKVDAVYDTLMVKVGIGKPKDIDSDLPSCSDSD